jgi:hypothetical protein
MGRSFLLDAFVRHNKILTKQEDFEIFLLSLVINLHFSKGQEFWRFYDVQFFKKSLARFLKTILCSSS